MSSFSPTWSELRVDYNAIYSKIRTSRTADINMAVFFWYVVFIPTCSQMEIHSNAIYLKTEVWLLISRTRAQSNDLTPSITPTFCLAKVLICHSQSQPNQTNLNGANANIVARICVCCCIFIVEFWDRPSKNAKKCLEWRYISQY